MGRDCCACKRPAEECGDTTDERRLDGVVQLYDAHDAWICADCARTAASEWARSVRVHD